MNKLKSLGLLGEDLLHTINGKEYITTARLKDEIRGALRQVRATPGTANGHIEGDIVAWLGYCMQAGGRLSLVELPALLGVDLVHCERQAATLVAESSGAVIEAQGELMTTQVREREWGRLGMAKLAHVNLGLLTG